MMGFGKYLIFFIYFTIVCTIGGFSQNLRKVELKDGAKNQLKNFLILLERYKNEGNKIQEADYLNKIAYLYWEKGSSADAIEYFNQSLQINNEVGNKNGLQAIYTNLGTIYFDEKYYQKAIENFGKSLEINKLTGKKRNVCGNLINLALSNGELNNYTKAIEILDDALELATELNDIRLRKTALSMLYEYHDNVGNKEKALAFKDEYMTLERALQKETMDVIQKQAKQAEQAKLKTERRLKQTFDTLQEVSELANRKQEELDQLKYINDLEQRKRELEESEREAKQKLRYIAISFVIGVLLIILFVIIMNNKRNKRINTLLEKQNREISTQRDIIESANINITNSINYAKRIQKALLPPISNLKSLIPESFIFFNPRDIVSGDFYWFSETKISSVISKATSLDLEEYGKPKLASPDDGIIISAIDCTGHGVPGAFMSMIGFNLVHEIISMGITEPDKILSVLNFGVRNQLKQKDTDNRDGMDMAICLYNQKKNTLEYSGAKNPLIYVQEGELFQIKGDYMPIGGFFKEDDERDYTKHTIKIDKPTTFYIFTDGFSDQIGGKQGRKYLSKFFRELLLEISESSLDKQEEILEKRLKDWMGNEYTQIDDILVIGFKLYPNK